MKIIITILLGISACAFATERVQFPTNSESMITNRLEIVNPIRNHSFNQGCGFQVIADMNEVFSWGYINGRVWVEGPSELNLELTNHGILSIIPDINFYGQRLEVGYGMQFIHNQVSDDFLVTIYPANDIDDDGVEHPMKFALNSIYPNPFNSTTTIKYSLLYANMIELGVYNQLGQRVAILHDGYQYPGIQTANFYSTSLPSGLYFVRLNSPDITINQKVILIR